MPQKRNPDVAELARGKAGRVIGDLVALLTTVKGLPLTYNRDLQEDKEPVFDAVDTLALTLPALTGAVTSLTFDRDRLETAAGGGHALATDLAEELVRRGVPFREAHDIVGGLVRDADETGVDVANLDVARIVAAHPSLDRSVVEVLDARAAVERRASPFGTATASVLTQLRQARDAVVRNRGT
jgi:argininosuccinate lyase